MATAIFQLGGVCGIRWPPPYSSCVHSEEYGGHHHIPAGCGLGSLVATVVFQLGKVWGMAATTIVRMGEQLGEVWGIW